MADPLYTGKFTVIGGTNPPVTMHETAPNEVGVFEVRGSFVASATSHTLRLGNGYQYGDMWVDDLAVVGATSVTAPYNGPYFDGNTADSEFLINAEWVGAENASKSTADFLALDPTKPPLVFERGKNLKLASQQGQGDVTNTLIMQTEEGWIEVEAPANTNSESKYGVVESALDTDSSTAVATQLATSVFSQKALPEEGSTYQIIPIEDHVPFKDFQVGDWVLAPDHRGLLVPRRVVSLSLTEDEAGNPVFSVEFDTIFRDNEEIIARWMARQAGSLGGSLANAGGGVPPSYTQPSPPPVPSPQVPDYPKAPTGLTGTASGAWTADGVYPISNVFLSWAGVTENVDGSDTVPEIYEVWGKNTATSDSSFAQYAATSATNVTISNFSPGQTWEFQVRAKNPGGEYGEFSAPFTVLMIAPASPMTAPSTPILASSSGILLVGWDGLLGSVAPPPQFRYVYAELATSSGGTFVRAGSTLSRDGRSISLPGLTVGSTYWIRLRAVDGVGLVTAPSAEASITVVGVDLGDLAGDVQDAIDAAEEAAREATETTNMLGDPSFELNTNEFWTLDSSVTNVTTSPRSGLRHLRIPSKAAPYTAASYARVLPCEPGDTYQFRIYVKATDTGVEDFVDNALELHIIGYTNESMASPTEYIIGASQTITTADYTAVFANWTVPLGKFFYKPTIYVRDAANDNVYYVDDVRLLRVSEGALILDGAIVAEKIAAEAVVAGKLAALSVATLNLQAQSVVAEKLAVGAVTAEKIAANAIEANHISAGAIQTNHLSPAVGGELDISANDSVQIIVGQIDSVQGDVNETNDNLEEMQTYYTFGTDGAVVTKPGSPFALALRNDRIEMLENGNVVSYWNSGQMYVTSFVGEKVVLGNHQLEKYGDGTVVRAL